MEKEQYCRCCGTGKGHTFSSCKNASSMRKIIQSQDDEMNGYLRTITSNEETVKGLGDRVAKLQADLNTALGSWSYLDRVTHALLDLAEMRGPKV